MPELTEKEEVILGSISRKPSISQRELARSTGISLGLINLIMKKFIKTGYIQVFHLNKKKVDYLLTPEGLFYAAKKTYWYANNTIKKYQQIQQNLVGLFDELIKEGYHYFSIHGDGELSRLIKSTFKETWGKTSATLGEELQNGEGCVVLKVSVDPITPPFNGKTVNVAERIGI